MLLANRNLFNNFFNDPFFERPFENATSQIMKTDIHEKDGNYQVDMELPGYAKENIRADLKDGYLTINATRNETKEEKDEKGKCIRKERYTGSCNRSFYVGDQITQDDIKASFKDGVLHLCIPKETPRIPEEEQPKLITIE
ncbi:MAG: Hsp20/alpha crystallin family protein [Hespellia sp.]|jgi:HSP20 family protein|nr:Hsp20/alpha crystallin family protein [Hespellia sp.]